jgi:hypothetical protein
MSTSTTEARCVAFSRAAKRLLWLGAALKDLRFLETLVAIFSGGGSDIDIAKDHQVSELARCIDIHHHSVQELVCDKTLPLMYILTMDNLTDMCNKSLPQVQPSKLCTIALGYNEGGR